MILCIDMGNTQTEIGVMDGDRLLMSERVSTDRKKTETEYAIQLHTIFEIRGIDKSKFEGAIISSVVPNLTYVIKKAIKKVTGLSAKVVGPGLKNGLKIRIDDPKTLGADMVVGAVGGIKLYGAPLIIVDMGTATTISYIDDDGAFRGGVIMPGVNVSLEGLVSGTSQLPKISLDGPREAIGTNTIDCMRSGIVYGQAGQIDGIIDRFHAEGNPEARVVATGGLSKAVIPYCRHDIRLDDELMITGLKAIYDLS